VSNDLATWLLANFTNAFEVIGVLAFALSGLIEAKRKGLDIVGVAMVAAVAAFGGGTLRDILLNRRPLFWVENDWWLWVIIGLTIAALLFLRSGDLAITERAMKWPDAIGLGVFAASGTQVALELQRSAIVAVIMGVLTSIIGGVLRDLFTNQIPRAFSDHEPYASVAFVGCWFVVLADALNMQPMWSVALGAAMIIVLRLLVMVFGWRVPSWRK
jgi:uncharacterized membrane protein YeiH